MNHFQKLAITSAIGISFAFGAFAQEEPTPDTVIATVNGKEIKLGHLAVVTERLPEQYKDISAAELFEGILDQIIQQTALTAGYTGNESKLQFAMENEARALRATEAIETLLEPELTEEKLKIAYDKRIENTEPRPEFRASHILVETEEEAKEILEMVKNGGDFVSLAKEKSTGPSGASGGDLGWFGRGAMVPEFDTAVADMKIDAISEPVKTQFGWHLIKLNDKRDFPPFEDMREEIEQQVREAVVQIEVLRLESAAKIEKTPITFDLEIIKDGSLFK